MFATPSPAGAAEIAGRAQPRLGVQRKVRAASRAAARPQAATTTRSPHASPRPEVAGSKALKRASAKGLSGKMSAMESNQGGDALGGHEDPRDEEQRQAHGVGGGRGGRLGGDGGGDGDAQSGESGGSHRQGEDEAHQRRARNGLPVENAPDGDQHHRHGQAHHDGGDHPAGHEDPWWQWGAPHPLEHAVLPLLSEGDGQVDERGAHHGEGHDAGNVEGDGLHSAVEGLAAEDGDERGAEVAQA